MVGAFRFPAGNRHGENRTEKRRQVRLQHRGSGSKMPNSLRISIGTAQFLEDFNCPRMPNSLSISIEDFDSRMPTSLRIPIGGFSFRSPLYVFYGKAQILQRQVQSARGLATLAWPNWYSGLAFVVGPLRTGGKAASSIGDRVPPFLSERSNHLYPSISLVQIAMELLHYYYFWLSYGCACFILKLHRG